MATTGRAAGVDPEAWKIIDGELYLYLNHKGGEKFAANADAEVKKADENWVKLNNDNPER
jgi:hypothetical protein